MSEPFVEVEIPVVRCPTCNVPWVLRWAIHLGGRPPEYVYQRDCKHKARPAGGDPLDDIEVAEVRMARPVAVGVQGQGPTRGES